MLDKKVETILNFLNENAGGSYTVLDIPEILKKLPKKLGIDGAEFASAINFLKEKEYISVKFQDNREICVAVTSRTGSYLQYKDTSTEKAEISKKQYAALFAFVTVAALLGSFLGVLVFKLLGL